MEVAPCIQPNPTTRSHKTVIPSSFAIHVRCSLRVSVPRCRDNESTWLEAQEGWQRPVINVAVSLRKQANEKSLSPVYPIPLLLLSLSTPLMSCPMGRLIFEKINNSTL